MRSKELNSAIAALKRMVESRRTEPAQAERLRKVLHELTALRKGGKVAQRRVVRVLGLVAEVVCDTCVKNEASDGR
jgi:hypothetical protein